jgi:hypothetical protein
MHKVVDQSLLSRIRLLVNLHVASELTSLVDIEELVRAIELHGTLEPYERLSTLKAFHANEIFRLEDTVRSWVLFIQVVDFSI